MGRPFAGPRLKERFQRITEYYDDINRTRDTQGYVKIG